MSYEDFLTEAFYKWLKYAVVNAEQELQSEPGKKKLQSVYNQGVKRYPWLGKFVSFALFSALVDETLRWMNNQVKQGKTLDQIITSLNFK